MSASEAQAAGTSADALYRYRDAEGVEHLVQGLGEVPREHRAAARPVSGGVEVEKRDELQRARDTAELRALQAQAGARRLAASVTSRPTHAFGFNLPSFVLGGGLALAVVLGFSLLRRSRTRALRLVMALVFASLAMGAYLTAFRTAGVPLIEDGRGPVDRAREAAEALRRSAAEQQRALDDIERSSK